jgi:hypothetical protein
VVELRPSCRKSTPPPKHCEVVDDRHDSRSDRVGASARTLPVPPARPADPARTPRSRRSSTVSGSPCGEKNRVAGHTARHSEHPLLHNRQYATSRNPSRMTPQAYRRSPVPAVCSGRDRADMPHTMHVVGDRDPTVCGEWQLSAKHEVGHQLGFWSPRQSCSTLSTRKRTAPSVMPGTVRVGFFGLVGTGFGSVQPPVIPSSITARSAFSQGTLSGCSSPRRSRSLGYSRALLVGKWSDHTSPRRAPRSGRRSRRSLHPDPGRSRHLGHPRR